MFRTRDDRFSIRKLTVFEQKCEENLNKIRGKARDLKLKNDPLKAQFYIQVIKKSLNFGSMTVT